MNRIRYDYPGFALATAAMIALSGCGGGSSDPGGGGSSDPEGANLPPTDLTDQRIETLSQAKLLKEAGIEQDDLAAVYSALKDRVDNAGNTNDKTANKILIRSSSKLENVTPAVVDRDGNIITPEVVTPGDVTVTVEVKYDANGDGPFFVVKRTDASDEWMVDTETDTPKHLEIDGTNGIVLAKAFDGTSRDGTVLLYAMSDREDAADDDYLSGGVWLFVPEDLTNAQNSDYVAEAFATGGVPYSSSSNFVPLTGEATYQGPAIGVYAYTYATTSNLVSDEKVETGGFTAIVSMTADFATDTSDGFLTRGSIGSFVFDNGEKLLGSETISLTQSKDFEDGGSGVFSGILFPPDPDVLRFDDNSGWSAQFFGENVAGEKPASIAGTFHGSMEWDTTVEWDTTTDDPPLVRKLDLLGAFNLGKQPEE